MTSISARAASFTESVIREMTRLAAEGATPLFVASTPKGAALVRPRDMQTLVSASAADIAAHAVGATQPQPRRTAAGGR